MIPGGRSLAVLCIAGGLLACARTASAQQETKLAPVPRSLPAPARDSLDRRRAAVERAIDQMNDTIARYNTRCSSFRADDAATRSFCEGEQARLLVIIQGIEARKTDFNAAVERATALASRAKKPGIDRIYVPSPVIARENDALRRDPAAWLAAAQVAVKAFAASNREWARAVLRAIDELSPPERQHRITRLADLHPGDILLVAPPSEQLDPAGAAVSRGVQAADYLTRVASDLASKRALEAARQPLQPASHALTFVKNVKGELLFLDHTLEGSRVLDARAFLTKYGARELYVARPNEVVDGRQLWTAASAAARQRKSDYGLLGKNVVCSERAGIAVARVTGVAPNHRLGPVDITPGDFFDAQGATGKHFTITRLYISATPGEQ